MSVGLILLAAGGSKRMGSPKQLVVFRGKSLLRHAAETALDTKCWPVVVVVGAEAERLGHELAGLDVKIVVNRRWEDGLASSIHVGLDEVGKVDGVVLMLCDQPLVRVQLLDSLAAAGELTAAEYGGSVGVPAFFPAAFFQELRNLKGDQGAKGILLRHSAKRILCEEASFDVDKIEDVRRLKEDLANLKNVRFSDGKV